MPLKQTPSQTVGPYFAYGLAPRQYGYPFASVFSPVVAEPHAAGEHIHLSGRVFDGAGQVVPDALIEISQVDASGMAVTSRAQAKAAGFHGFGRCGTGSTPDASFWFETVKPGSPGPGIAPHINLIVSMRGLLLHAFTRIYFDDAGEANATDTVLAAVPADRRDTLLALKQTGPGIPRYRFDLYMQGPQETVFFDL